ncbi:MAG: hypothetical protein JWN78_1365 [Bacteroidota bacterium]|nr:hypothetical protein [Bacteroidota bacterium]
MRVLLLFIVLFSSRFIFAQDDIVLDLDSIKNIKTTRYSSVNEVGVAINIGGTVIDKLPSHTTKTKQGIDKPSVMIRTVHGILINPKFFIGAGLGIDFLPSGGTTGGSFLVTFPIFAEFREYILDGNFNIFFSERLGGAIFLDKKVNTLSGQKRTSSGAFGEFMIGGRYVPSSKKLAIHFGVGYRLQHLQTKVNFTDTSTPTQVISNVKQITIKHYIPVSIGVTF